MTLLIDADWLIYTACCAAETDIRWDEYIHTLHSEPSAVKAYITDKIAGWKSFTSHSKVVMCWSDYPSFRAQLYPEYKSTRIGKRKPLALKATRQWCSDRFESRTIPNLEGDDVLGLLATSNEYKDPIIVAIDKDMRTIPGKLLVDDTLVTITSTEAVANWMLQTLTGDAADNYPGIKGCGPKTAAKILEGTTTLSEMWALVLAAYKKAGLTFDDALLNARLSRILRNSDYDFATDTVKLWEPMLQFL